MWRGETEKVSLKHDFVVLSLDIRALEISFSLYGVHAHVSVVFISKIIVIKGFVLDGLKKTSIYLSG